MQSLGKTFTHIYATYHLPNLIKYKDVNGYRVTDRAGLRKQLWQLIALCSRGRLGNFYLARLIIKGLARVQIYCEPN